MRCHPRFMWPIMNSLQGSIEEFSIGISENLEPFEMNNTNNVIGKFVICGKDCNKHTSKIFNCCSTFEECITFLNTIGEKVVEEGFDIQEFRIDYERQEILGSYMSFSHVKLFKELYDMCEDGKPYCTHKGEIHILQLQNTSNFFEVYEFLAETYC